ncbi:hypothetical protein [Candidatus Ichthyocystis sparus]|uniref:hypothetical protein n=1 Tax=Candidatus Ichthyocystis sparus TaxID=1561004 RepID=UPI000B874EA5|nr:hypothetical protein [Candidatus Ichthyocystis sparus]
MNRINPNKSGSPGSSQGVSGAEGSNSNVEEKSKVSVSNAPTTAKASSSSPQHQAEETSSTSLDKLDLPKGNEGARSRSSSSSSSGSSHGSESSLSSHVSGSDESSSYSDSSSSYSDSSSSSSSSSGIRPIKSKVYKKALLDANKKLLAYESKMREELESSRSSNPTKSQIYQKELLAAKKRALSHEVQSALMSEDSNFESSRSDSDLLFGHPGLGGKKEMAELSLQIAAAKLKEKVKKSDRTKKQIKHVEISEPKLISATGLDVNLKSVELESKPEPIDTDLEQQLEKAKSPQTPLPKSFFDEGGKLNITRENKAEILKELQRRSEQKIEMEKEKRDKNPEGYFKARLASVRGPLIPLHEKSMEMGKKMRAEGALLPPHERSIERGKKIRAERGALIPPTKKQQRYLGTPPPLPVRIQAEDFKGAAAADGARSKTPPPTPPKPTEGIKKGEADGARSKTPPPTPPKPTEGIKRTTEL